MPTIMPKEACAKCSLHPHCIKIKANIDPLKDVEFHCPVDNTPESYTKNQLYTELASRDNVKLEHLTEELGKTCFECSEFSVEGKPCKIHGEPKENCTDHKYYKSGIEINITVIKIVHKRK